MFISIVYVTGEEGRRHCEVYRNSYTYFSDESAKLLSKYFVSSSVQYKIIYCYDFVRLRLMACKLSINWQLHLTRVKFFQ